MKKKRLMVLILIMAVMSSALYGCGAVDKSSSSETKANKDSSYEVADKEDTSSTATSKETTAEQSGDEATTEGDGNVETTTTPDESSSSTTEVETTTKNDTTTKNQNDTTTASTTTKNQNDTTAPTTTSKPAETTTKKNDSSETTTTAPTNYGAVINHCNYDANKYSRRVGIDESLITTAENIIKNEIKITTSMTEVERVKAIHDWMVKNINYDYDAASKVTGGNTAQVADTAFNAYGCLVNRNVVCEGYSEGFMLLCWVCGIEARLVTGDANNGSGSVGHEWNVVKIAGKWYQVDVTWDDPALNGVQNDPNGANLRYDYFLITTNDMAKDHSGFEFEKSEVITCTSTDYYAQVDAWAISNKLGNIPYTKVTSYAEADAAALKYMQQGLTTFAVVYDEGTLDYNTIMSNTKAVYGAYLENVTHPANVTKYSFGVSITDESDRGYSIDTMTLKLTYTYKE